MDSTDHQFQIHVQTAILPETLHMIIRAVYMFSGSADMSQQLKMEICMTLGTVVTKYRSMYGIERINYGNIQ